MPSGEDANDIVSGKLKYASVLDVSFFTIYQDHSMKYKAKINTQPGLPKVAYIIINIILLIQLIGPSFFIDSPNIWDQGNVFAYFLKSIGCIWQLWPGQPRIIAGLIFAILDCIYEFLNICLIIRFSKRQVASRVEGVFTLLLGKYVRPILMVLMLSALGEAINDINNVVSIVYLVFFVICILMTPYDLYMLSIRLLTENNPNHEWQSFYPTVTWLTTAAVIILSSSIGFVNTIGQSIMMIVCAIVYALFSSYCFLYSPTIKRQFSTVVGATAATGCIISIISVIITFVGNVSPAVLIVLFIVVFVICYLLFHFLGRKKMMNLMMIFNQCEGCPDDADEILARSFSSPMKLIAAVHIVFQNWPPFLMSWKPFSTFAQKYPDHHELCCLWCRICSLFPQEHELFRWLINQYANMKPHVGRTTFLVQMIAIQSSRFTDTTPSVLKSISAINKTIANAAALQHRFWERILQKSTDVFWADISSLKKMIEKIEIDINMLLDSHPNNADLVELYCSFLLHVKADFSGYQHWLDNLHQLQAGNRLRPDFALHAAQHFLPELQQFCIESQSKKSDDMQGNVTSSEKVPEVNHQLRQVQAGLQQFIKKAHVGGILFGSIILTIGTILSIVVFSIYLNQFEDNLIGDTKHKADFMKEVNVGLLNLGFLGIYVAMYPLALLGVWTPCNLVPAACPNLMKTIAPNLYSSGRIVNWTFQQAYVGSIVAAARDRLLYIQFALSNLSTDGTKGIYQSIFTKPFADNMPIIQVMTKHMISATTLLKHTNANDYFNDPLLADFDTGLDQILDDFIKFPQEMWKVSVAESSKQLSDLNQNFVLTIFVAFILISLPLILTHFNLVMESNSVSSCFISLPNTAVREILQSHEKKGEGKSNNSQAIALSSSANSSRDRFEIYAIFILSVGCILGASLYLYYESSIFAETANNELKKISVFHQPGVYALMAEFRVIMLTLIDIMDSRSIPITLGFGRAKQNELATSLLAKLQESITDSYWGINGVAGVYYSVNPKMDYFSDIVPGASDDGLSLPLSIFEEIATIEMIDELGIAATNMQFLLKISELMKLNTQNNIYFLPLAYYFSGFVGSKRFPLFFNPILEAIYNGFSLLVANSSIILAIVAIVQILALFIMVFYLYKKSSIIKQSLSMLLFFNPTVVLQNQNVMSLVSTGSLKAYNDENSYKDAEKVLECTHESIVLMDKKLIINDMNDSFLNCVGLSKEDLVCRPITDILKSVSKIQSIESIMIKVNEILRGIGTPTLKEKMHISIPDGTEKIVVCNVLFLTPMGTATESDVNETTAIAFIIEDQTEHQLIEQKIHDEKQKITDMLNRVMPVNVVEELQKGSDSISLAVQSASVGCIKVSSNSKFDNEDFNAPFKFYAKVYTILDDMMKEFTQLTKVRTFSHTYEYAGGLFGSVNKPDKHAEEATRFALKVITNAKKIEQAVGQDVNFTIGLNTGGPLVAGVISINKPHFHLIGPTVELAQRMKSTGIKMQIHVTRSVYELVYAYNFRVTERGDTDIGGGKTLRTYVIVP